MDDARNALIAVLNDIQVRSGLPCPQLTGSTVPPTALEKFDSTVWPAATTLVARRLGVTIPHDIHIFGDKGAAPLSINQTATLICAKAQAKAPVKAAA
ncbi:hypothetical protein A9995_14235 [Erythrobacter sp. QSSC1-22B]|nr:hypothetical protein A9995_14235 [Erythrobacter sp. QSSC1-22B]